MVSHKPISRDFRFASLIKDLRGHLPEAFFFQCCILAFDSEGALTVKR